MSDLALWAIWLLASAYVLVRLARNGYFQAPQGPLRDIRVDLPDGRYVPRRDEDVPPPWANDDREPHEVAACDYQGECLTPAETPQQEKE